MVRERGLEPISRPFFMFSSLLIFAFLCANLRTVIQTFPSQIKSYLASNGNNGQENLCGTVRVVRKVCENRHGLILCGDCAAFGQWGFSGIAIARLRVAAPKRSCHAGWFIGGGH